MDVIVSYYKKLSEDKADVYERITTNGQPDSQKLRVFLNENNVECRGSNMKSLVSALDTFLNKKNQQTEPVQHIESKFENTIETKIYVLSDFDKESLLNLSYEYEVLYGAYTAGKPDDARQRALEDAHIRCDQTLSWILEVKNSGGDFDKIVKGVQYASDIPPLANALFELFITLH